MPIKRVVEVIEDSPFGEDIDEGVMENPALTPNFLPGYSDVRIEREKALARGEKPPPLPFRFHCVRAKTLDGKSDDGRNLFQREREGYVPLKWDEAESYGVRPEENKALKRDDVGNVTYGEYIFMVTDAKRAATNLKRVQRDQQDQEDRYESAVEAAVQGFEQRTGIKSGAFSMVEDAPTAIEKAKKK
jgi:hypothetical protein